MPTLAVGGGNRCGSFHTRRQFFVTNIVVLATHRNRKTVTFQKILKSVNIVRNLNAALRLGAAHPGLRFEGVACFHHTLAHADNLMVGV